MRPFTPKAPTASLPPLPLRLLPGGANQFPGGSCDPLKSSAFSTAHYYASQLERFCVQSRCTMPVSPFQRYVFVVLLLRSAARCTAQQTPVKRLPSSEREALLALYKATDGSRWKEKSGWLGPPGTECEWHGVQCGEHQQQGGEAVPTVWFLDLGENNLVGTIPPQIGALEGLQWVSLYGNKIQGILPNLLIQRWLNGTLDISAEAHLLTTITVIDYSFLASLCCVHNDG